MSLTKDSPDGVILRTAAQGMHFERLRGEYARLRAQWADMKKRSDSTCAPKLFYDDNDLALQAVRDMLTEDVEALWTDDARYYEHLAACVGSMAPDLLERIHRHDGATPLFDLYRVDAQLEKALQRFVWLKDGGSLVIDETEALTAVDVNTGKNSRKYR
jgi:ribonuclease E